MKKLLLIGGGHAHVFILKALQKEKLDMEVTMISPSVHQYYSGMFSGYTEGIYNEEDIRIDLSELAASGGASFRKGEVQSIDPLNKEAVMKEERIPFDLISFDIGSLVRKVPGSGEEMYSVKPNHVFPENISRLKRSEEPVVVGGGAAGVELALSMLAWRKKNQVYQRVTLIDSGDLLEEFGEKASKKAKTIAAYKGLSFITGERVEQIGEDGLLTDKGRNVSHSGVLWLSGAEAPPLFERSGLNVDSKGFLLVNDQLRNDEYPFVYGAGDCVSLYNSSIPKNGVFAVRQAPVLWENLKREVMQEDPVSFRPPKTYMAILSTGDREGLLSYGKLILHHHLCFRLKHFIDSKFMEKYQK
ncbi:FAD-dependent oxidoreductase [Salimicrobium flavidum]|uniref:NADH dehydrogenase, FAD-containing subunit n=1 Tax=Salimicrobium flavidum TaxID=570947 RepID=A0A1N7J941_9BACI|nr:FAD-dependent oxidoreductase [Salimicrobium flavidum]SIS45863.1 NADH dehydrogenase, FAD-containing subunit [Salimicrobium flavidum]